MANNDQLRVFKDDPIKYEKRKEKMSDSESTDDEVEVKAEKSVFKAYLW